MCAERCGNERHLHGEDIVSGTNSQLPPSGWYGKPGQPGTEQWWDGASWTGHTRATPTALTPPPPPSYPQAPALHRPPAYIPPHSAGMTCPVCRSNDQMRRVTVVIGEGTSATQGSALTIARREGRTRVDSTSYNSNSITELSSRLTPPPRPSFPWLTYFLGWTFGLAALVGFFAVSQGEGGSMGASLGAFIAGFLTLFVTWIPALLISAIIHAFKKRGLEVRGAEWDRRDARLRAAYYCGRDDVIIEGDRAYQPEKYLTGIFSAPYPAPQDKAPAAG